jgi:hypothetical protein
VIDLVIVFIYPHGGTLFYFASTNVLVVRLKNNTAKKFSYFANKPTLFEDIEIKVGFFSQNPHK